MGVFAQTYARSRNPNGKLGSKPKDILNCVKDANGDLCCMASNGFWFCHTLTCPSFPAPGPCFMIWSQPDSARQVDLSLSAGLPARLAERVRAIAGRRRFSTAAYERAVIARARRARRNPPPVAGSLRITPPVSLCYDAKTSKLVGKGSKHDGLTVTMISLIEDAKGGPLAIVQSPGLPGGGQITVPLCADKGPWIDSPAPGPTPPGVDTPDDFANCCIDPETGTITCPGGTEQWFMHGKTVPKALFQCTPDGTCTITMSGDEVQVLPICRKPPDDHCCYDAATETLQCDDKDSPLHNSPAVLVGVDESRRFPHAIVQHPLLNGGDRTILRFCPEHPPTNCCYDAARGELRCHGNPQWDGLTVGLETMGTMGDGTAVASVASPQLPGGRGSFPLCDDDTPPDCCYDADLGTLRCPNDPELDGTVAGVVVEFVGPDGQPWVSVAWSGGGARVPLCPGQKCPPSFCCVNADTGTLVCPNDNERNGLAVHVSRVELDQNGYRWAVLEDDTRIPICGSECLPPKLCPDCPTCPPGMWMTPDGNCSDGPKCPPKGECPPPKDCPPGKTPPGGRTPPGTPPWWKKLDHCCEDCALGHACAGPSGIGGISGIDSGNCGCSGPKKNPGPQRPKSNPAGRGRVINPAPGMTYDTKTGELRIMPRSR